MAGRRNQAGAFDSVRGPCRFPDYRRRALWGGVSRGVSVGKRAPDPLGLLYIRQNDLDLLRQAQWYRVCIDNGYDMRAPSVTGMINKFVEIFISSGLPSDVQVVRDPAETAAHAYYFSPGVAAIARNLLASYEATPCITRPNLASMKRARF